MATESIAKVKSAWNTASKGKNIFSKMVFLLSCYLNLIFPPYQNLSKEGRPIFLILRLQFEPFLNFPFPLPAPTWEAFLLTKSFQVGHFTATLKHKSLPPGSYRRSSLPSYNIWGSFNLTIVILKFPFLPSVRRPLSNPLLRKSFGTPAANTYSAIRDLFLSQQVPPVLHTFQNVNQPLNMLQ